MPLRAAILAPAMSGRRSGPLPPPPAPAPARPKAVENKATKRLGFLRDRLEHNLLRLSAVLFMVGAVGWCLLIANQFRTPALVASAGAAISKADLGLDRTDPSRSSTYVRIDEPSAAALREWPLSGGEAPARVVAEEWNLLLETRQETRQRERDKSRDKRNALPTAPGSRRRHPRRSSKPSRTQSSRSPRKRS